MRLDMDCIRDILLCVEANTCTHRYCTFFDISMTTAAQYVGREISPLSYQRPLDQQYGNEKLIYHLKYCKDANLVYFSTNSTPGNFEIVVTDLTVEGHKLVNNIREPKNWSKTKEIGSKIGAFGLEMAEKISEGVATAYFKQLLGL